MHKLSYFICIVYILLVGSMAYGHDMTWKEVKRDKVGSIDLYWNVSRPFIFKNSDGTMGGIEAELLEGFVTYLDLTYDIKLTLNYIESESFKAFYELIKNSTTNGEFGVSALSITPDRKEHVLFTVPYMIDVAVMVSRSDVPLFSTLQEFRNYAPSLKAITVEATTYEAKLKELRADGFNFDIEYIPSIQPIIPNIINRNNAFGYVDLPLYLIELKNDPSMPIFRQNLYPIKGQGYGLIMPKNSDWKPIFDEYLKSPYFLSIKDKIIGHYLEKDIYNIIKNLSIGENVNADELIILLTKEKEFQNNVLTKNALQNQQEKLVRIGLLILVIGTFIIAIFYYRLYVGKKGALEDLEIVKEKIEQQQLKIEQANAQLLDMNDEKNNLIRVLAHDLRSPINQIAGLAEIFLLENKELEENQKDIINQIIKSSMRLRDMISKILDAEAVETLQPKVKNERVIINEIFEGLEKEYGNSASKKHIKLNFEVDNNLSIEGDFVFIDQILDNLLSNAIKFSNANSLINLTGAAIDSDTIEIKIKDQGPGFTVADQKNMFKKFQRLSAQPTGGEQSTGLGLNIVKMYTELMGGTIEFESKVGEGTTFTLRFKRWPEA